MSTNRFRMPSKKELLILSYLRKNARLKLTKLAKLTKIPVSTIFDRIKAGSTFVQKHTTLVDFQKLGFATRAHIMIKGDKQEREGLQNFLLQHKLINSAYRINNGYDFLIEGIFHDLKEVEDFFEEMESTFKIKDRKVYYIINDLKREEFLSNPEYVKLIFPEG